MNTTSVDAFLADGCGRCDHYKTPACKVHLWTQPLVALRALVQATELVEDMKWGSPTYTLDGHNVVMIAAFKAHCCLSFFKGVLLTDPDNALESPGPNSNIGRLLSFTSAAEVQTKTPLIQRFLTEAIALERAGAQVPKPASPEPMPDELQAALDADPTLRAAFDALTPGRQRSYILHVSGAKQEKSRVSRAAKSVAKILTGKGFNER